MTPAEFSPEREDAIEQAATAWLCEREEGFSPERARAFAAWCEADLRHAAVVLKVERTLEMLAEMPAVRAPLEARFGPVRTSRAEVKPRRRWRAVSLLGAAAALALGGFFAWRMVPANGAPQHYASVAEQRRIELPDGSVVNLNVRSELQVSFTARRREVTLAAGEAHFAVAHDPARPFVVTAEGVSVRAVGTAFNVRLAPRSVEVLVVEGRVELSRDEAAARAVTGPQVGAGERASVDFVGGPRETAVEKAPPALIRETLAWHSRVASFTDVPLRDVAAQFNLRNVTQLVVEDDIGARKVGGTFALDEVEAFVRLLEQDGDVAGQRRGDREILLRRAP
jgi:transmembrane sensor